MNHIYCSIWSESLRTWIAVSEHAKHRTKSASPCKKVIAISVLLYSSGAWALPTGEQVVAGQVNVARPNSAQMQIQQNSQQAIVNWQGFSIAPTESVNIQQPNTQAVLLNRVVGVDASIIQGQLNANGQVYLVNPNGVLFSKTAQVDVGGLIASTHNILDADFLNGHYHFFDDGATGVVTNQGVIKVPNGGLVALIGNQVSNEGSIFTPGGTTALAAGKTVDLDFQGHGLVEVKVPEAALNAQVENKGAILADGGRVVLTAQAAGELTNTVLNSEGLIQAHSLAERNGEIILDGGSNGVTQVSGKLDVSGSNAGGKITVTGKDVNINSNANLTAQAENSGTAGTIKVFGNMESGVLNVAGKLDASAPNTGDGGFIETSAAHVNIADSAQITTKASNGKNGNWLIDPYDFTIAASGGDITGAALSTALSLNDVAIRTGLSSVTCIGVSGCGTGNSTGNGDIFVNDTISWSSNSTLSLEAIHNIYINADITGSGTGSNLILCAYNPYPIIPPPPPPPPSPLGTITASAAVSINGYFLLNGGNWIQIGSSLPSFYARDFRAGATFVRAFGGDGSISNPYQLTDIYGLQGMGGSYYYTLANDVDATVTSNWNAGEGFRPIGKYVSGTYYDLPPAGAFYGGFDGLGHTITGLTINRPTEGQVGLFGWVAESGEIRNIGLLNVDIKCLVECGGLVGLYKNYYVTGPTGISNSYVTGNIVGDVTEYGFGGLVGVIDAWVGGISNSYSTANVSGGWDVGGLLGTNYASSEIKNVYATGNVTSTAGSSAGGLIGGVSTDTFKLSNAYATGNVTDTSGSGVSIGGLIGDTYCFGSCTLIISNAFATGNVTGYSGVGGLVGYNVSSIDNSYATGNVTGNTNIGGLVGDNAGNISNSYASNATVTGSSNTAGLVGGNSGTISNSFWNTETTGQSIGVAVGDSTGTVGKTTAEMMQLATFSAAGWDIRNIGAGSTAWRLYEGHTAPLLTNFMTPLTLTDAPDASVVYNGSIQTGSTTANTSVLGSAATGTNVGFYNGYYSTQLGYDITGGNLTITPAALNIIGLSGSRSYDGTTAFDSSILTASGVIGSDVIGLSGVGYVSSANVGSYTGFTSSSTLTLSNPNYTLVGGTVLATITPASLSITANNASKNYGQTLTFAGSEFSSTGLQNSETIGAVNLASTGSVATANVSASPYAITASAASGGTFLASNYSISYTDGALTVNPASLSITANNASKTYDGLAYTGGNGVTYTGFVNGETNAVLGGTLSYTGSSQSAINAGLYAITPTGLTSTNYSISYTNGTLTVNPAVLTYTANPATRTYGAANPALSGTVTGFVTGETQATATTGTLGFTSPATNTSNVGSYAINGSGLVANFGNYTFSQALPNNTALSITPASLSITANNASKTYGQTLTFAGTEFSATGLQNSETIGSVNLTSAGTVATANVSGSPYTVTASNANGGSFLASNYSISYTNGVLTVNPASLSITANNASKTYGQTLTFTGSEFSSTGLQNSEIIGLVNLASLGTSATADVLGSPYAITASNASGGTFLASNYNITYMDGLLTVIPTAPAITPTLSPNQSVQNNITGLVKTVTDIQPKQLPLPQSGSGFSTVPVITDILNSTAISDTTNDFVINSPNPIVSAIETGLANITIFNTLYNFIVGFTTPTVSTDSNNSASTTFFNLFNNPTQTTIFDTVYSFKADIAATNTTISKNNPVENTTPQNDLSGINGSTSPNTTSQTNLASATGFVNAYSFLNNRNTFNSDFAGENCKGSIEAILKKPECAAPGGDVKPTLNIKNSSGRVKDLQISANRQFLSLLLEDGSVRVWDLQRGVQRQIVTPNKNKGLTDLSTVDDEGELVSIAGKANIGAYDLISSSNVSDINEANIGHFVTSSDGSLLLVSSSSGDLSLWNNKQNKELWHLPYHRGSINSLALSNNKNYAAILLGREQGAYELGANLQMKRLTSLVDIIDPNTGKIIKSLPNMDEQIVYMQFKENDTLQLGLASGEIFDWHIPSNSQKTIADFAEKITAVDATDNMYSYVLKDGTVRIGNGQGVVQLSLQNKEDPFKYAMLLGDGKRLLTVLDSGDLALWDVGSGQKLLRLFSTLQGWTVMDAFGRFDGSEEALENFSWIANEENIPLNSFSETYYEPGLLGKVLQNQDYLNDNPYIVQGGISLPPKVELHLADHQTKGDNVALQLDIYDRGGGIKKIQVFHNGKILSNEHAIVARQTSAESDAKHQALSLNITPSPGKNTLKVVASNDMGIENSSNELSFDGKTKAYASSLRIFTVGISKYSDANLNLDYSVADADSIGKTIKSISKIAASKSLHNENATKAKILAELKEISQGAQQDELVIYFAGHGIAVGKEWYFLPYETKTEATPEKLAATGVTASELSEIFKYSKIQHILFMVDACYSGAGMEAFNKLENGQRYFSRQLSRSLGITVLTAAAKDQGAAELTKLGHGLFTYMILQELQKNNADGLITAHGVAKNLVTDVPVFSKKILGTAQEPAAYIHGNDFILTDVSKKTTLKLPSKTHH